VLVVHLAPNRVDRKLPQRPVSVAVDFDLRRAVTAILALADVEVEEIDHAECIAVLVRIENESKLLEEEFGVRLGRLSVDLLVENEATLTGHRLEDELMLRSLVLRRNEARELVDRLFDGVASEGFRVGIEVDGERVEVGELVDAAGGVGDESRLPVAVRRDGGELGEGEADGERVTGNGKLVLVTNMDVSDLRRRYIVSTVGGSGRKSEECTSICKLSTTFVMRLAVKLWFFCSSSALIPLVGLVVSSSAFSSFSSLAACARAASSSGVALDESVGTARR
jgi:hypothetical protein